MLYRPMEPKVQRGKLISFTLIGLGVLMLLVLLEHYDQRIFILGVALIIAGIARFITVAIFNFFRRRNQ